MLDLRADASQTPPNGHIAAAAARDLDVRLAATPAEREAATALRYRVFFEEHGARSDALCRLAQRDVDGFDAACDHLIVVDRGRDDVVGTYRLLRRSVAMRRTGFYSAREFDLAPLLRQPGELLELGRSCIDARYRTGGTMALLWQGIARYVFAHDVTVMFGCASFAGSDPKAIAQALAHLHARHLAPPELRASALPGRRLEMRLEAGAAAPDAAALPPLLKGYMRLGGFVGDGAVIDDAFNTIDVCVVVKTSLLKHRYQRHYARQVGAIEAGTVAA